MGRRVGVTHSFAVCDEETGMIIDGKGINQFMSRTELVSQVSEWVESIVADSPIELVDVEYVKEAHGWVLRVYLDKPGGIDLEDCRFVSEVLSDVLDREDPIPGPYSLEVSSPGLERPLKKEADYHRFTGRLVNIRTYSAINGRKNFQGTLLELKDGDVFVDVDGQPVAIPLAMISKARLAVEF
jgi:ribosome maturation factor RimP